MNSVRVRRLRGLVSFVNITAAIFSLTVVVVVGAIITSYTKAVARAQDGAMGLIYQKYELVKLDPQTRSGGMKLVFARFVGEDGSEAKFLVREGAPGFEELAALAEGARVRFQPRPEKPGFSASLYRTAYVRVVPI